MAMIKFALLYSMLASLSVQELRDVYGFTQLDLLWVLVELVLWAMITRRGLNFEVPFDVRCIEFFAGSERSSQIAKAFSELGFRSLAFDLLRNLACFLLKRDYAVLLAKFNGDLQDLIGFAVETCVVFQEVKSTIWPAPMALSVRWWPYLHLFAVESATWGRFAHPLTL